MFTTENGNPKMNGVHNSEYNLQILANCSKIMN